MQLQTAVAPFPLSAALVRTCVMSELRQFFLKIGWACSAAELDAVLAELRQQDFLCPEDLVCFSTACLMPAQALTGTMCLCHFCLHGFACCASGPVLAFINDACERITWEPEIGSPPARQV